MLKSKLVCPSPFHLIILVDSNLFCLVYPSKTKDELANTTVERLMNEPEVKALLGTTQKIQNSRPVPFYRALQHYVDSKEKATEDEKKKKAKGEKKQMECWPLIKVVRIYTKADALSTGAVIVDLPGVHDSNAARAAVAAGYMKQCTGLWIVAPINRAVDDKAAKSLLGESFKRQLKYDGTYSRITFICSKTDDIAIMEASDSLGLEEEMTVDWAKIDEIDGRKTTLKKRLVELNDSRTVYSEVMSDADDAAETWEKLKEDLEDGKTVYKPSEKSKKRKRSVGPKGDGRNSKKLKDNEEDEEDDFDAEIEDPSVQEESADEEDDTRKALTVDQIDSKLVEFKETKRRARRERVSLDEKIKEINEEVDSLEQSREEIQAAMSAQCIEGRNQYSRGAIQQYVIFCTCNHKGVKLLKHILRDLWLLGSLAPSTSVENRTDLT